MQLNCHKYTSWHRGRTGGIENDCDTGARARHKSSSNLESHSRIIHYVEVCKSVCVRVFLELGEMPCNATDCLEILCAPCCSQMQDGHRC